MSDCDQTDEELARLIASDRTDDRAIPLAQDAFRRLRSRYESMTMRYLASLSDKETASDLHQETWLRVWNKAQQFDGQCFRAWLFQIAKYAALDHHRKLKRRPEQSLPKEGYLDPADDELAIDQLIDVEERSALASCLSELEQRSREIVVARLQGRDYDAIAEAWEVSVANARKILHRSKDLLANCVKRKVPA